MALEAISVPEPRVEAITTFEASTRLDAVASAGFRLPRSAMVELIEHREVRVNWKEVVKPAAELKVGGRRGGGEGGRFWEDLPPPRIPRGGSSPLPQTPHCPPSFAPLSPPLKAGDIISVRGKGRLEIGEIAPSKKDRLRINLTRFV